jgi:hypothetical protein
MPNGTYIKADFRAHLELLKPQGFTLNSDEIFEKTINNGKIFLYIASTEYFPHSVSLGLVNIGIRFTNVETLFKQACNGTSNAIYSADDDDVTFGCGFGKSVIGEANFRSLFDNEVEDDLSFQKIRHLLQQMIDAALAWANQNDTLQKAYDNAEALTLDARSNLYSQPFPNKYLIIKKLLNKTDFQDYFDELIDFYTNDEPDTNEVLFLNAQKTILDAL